MSRVLHVHDLLRLDPGARLISDGAPPAWVAGALDAAPWVVVRRSAARDGLVPVGVRGVGRDQRWGGWIAPAAVELSLAPEALRVRLDELPPERVASLPALAALRPLASMIDRPDRPWGPSGSAGFELASGRPTVTAASDLDLVICCAAPIAPAAAADLAREIADLGTRWGVRCDVLLETPAGGVALLEWARTGGPVAARGPDGPRLVDDPWTRLAEMEAAP